ncbi:beta-fructofuranosidase, insoluble isoenzyme CWINV1-like [Capsicum annuum]|uniref:beta-fructofuranosidase, insoluble isoenzyme CWINV1-like n=1 Tax=Capsicum annuum TaxID=4072 RepID=UPI001FB11ABF|nr:beta-fructofuranosidase, insoluble isoenzyme CWINV1-like [Capsicum annuum]
MNSVVEDNTALMPGSVREISGVVKNFFFARIFLTYVEMSFSAKTLENAEKWEGNWTNPQQVCSIIGASVKGGIGPFGLPHTCLLVIMTKPLCGAFLNVPLQEKLSLRTLIDHSIVESFGGEGKACITARVYPTNLAVDGATHLYFFNNGSQSIHISKFTAWTMKSAQIN